MTADQIRDAATKLVNKNLSELESDMHAECTLGFVGGQREAVRKAMTDIVYATMLAMHTLHRDSADTAAIREVIDPEQQEKRTVFGKCAQCGAPFYHPQAAEAWMIGGQTVLFCVTCSDMKKKRPKR